MQMMQMPFIKSHPMPEGHIMKAHSDVHQHLTQQSLQICQHGAQLAISCSPQDTQDILSQWLALQSASVKKFTHLQLQWFDQWSSWADYAQSVDGANTLSKVTARTNNIGLQAQAQCAEQINQLANLLENSMVNNSYFLAKQTTSTVK